MEYLKDVKKLVERKTKGEKWVEEVLPLIVKVNADIKEIKAKMEEEVTPLKIIIDGIKVHYESDLGALVEADAALREWILKEHEGTEAVSKEDVGTLVFPQRWGFDVVDLSKVDRKYLKLDPNAVSTDIRNGITHAKGLKIEKKRGLEVRTK